MPPVSTSSWNFLAREGGSEFSCEKIKAVPMRGSERTATRRRKILFTFNSRLAVGLSAGFVNPSNHNLAQSSCRVVGFSDNWRILQLLITGRCTH
jgi:hypothetical protein